MNLHEWVRHFCVVSEALAEAEQSNVVIPGAVHRAESVLAAEHDFEGAVGGARRISCGKERSKALRDLCVRAVRHSHYNVIPSLCRDMVHHRSEQLADPARELADHASPTNSAARDVFERLVLACSDYPDAAYRAVAASIRFVKPEPESVFGILSKLSLSPGAK